MEIPWSISKKLHKKFGLNGQTNNVWTIPRHIGDIHGYAHVLRRLLTKLGYAESHGVFRHGSRKAIFVGDFVDRGPAQREVLKIARRMCDAGGSVDRPQSYRPAALFALLRVRQASIASCLSFSNFSLRRRSASGNKSRCLRPACLFGTCIGAWSA